MDDQDQTRNPDIKDLLARSSLGGDGWCNRCDHPRDLHQRMSGERVCFGSGCHPHEFEPMSPEKRRRRFG